MKLKIRPEPLLMLLLLLSACKEFIEPSIKDKKVIVNAPADQYSTTKYTVNFWWDELEDALSYHLQIVNPNFTQPEGLVVDTVIPGSKFAITLEPGTYQWHLRAENGSSATTYSEARNFIIQEGSLQNQTLQIVSPANNFLTNQAALSFQWGSLFGATKYRLQIDTNNFVDEQDLVYDQVTPAQQLRYTFPADQTYTWRVRAENDTEQSKWTTINTLTFDRTPPGTVALSAPANNAQVALNISLQWRAVPGASKYKLYVYKGNSGALYNQNFPLSLTPLNYTFTLGTSGEQISWKVSAVDAAGNEGAASEVRSFTLQ